MDYILPYLGSTIFEVESVIIWAVEHMPVAE